jgi:hypothetical protein
MPIAAEKSCDSEGADVSNRIRGLYPSFLN